MDDISAKENVPLLRRVKFTDKDGLPFTTFIALDNTQWSDLIAQEVFDLQPFAKHILSVIPGHTPTTEDIAAAWQCFSQIYTGVHTGYNGHPQNPPEVPRDEEK